ncbi:hypothetical protein KCG44_03855 [Pacificimonas sp. WHA3]|uniref:Transmembrane protein n=1 Tax=Pacificimonas pallii TaxID=2827236 RepID=A0ABS6SCG5_9SPHN|nr:hypothetical protein [Pacificimonas pallii]MBV7255915.1 hypothetical protein [Pacificimonas pallii]
MNRKTENPSRIILLVAIGLLMTISLVAAVYWQTRTKWYELGLSAGSINLKYEIVAELCEYGIKAPPPRTPDVQIGVKTAAFSLISENGQVLIFCQGLE